MVDEKKPIVWMVILGVVRHVLSIAGTWMVSRGLIDADTHQRIMNEGAVQLVGYVLMLAPIAWSVMQKYQVWGWVKTALHLDERRMTVGAIPAASAGPSMPI